MKCPKIRFGSTVWLYDVILFQILWSAAILAALGTSLQVICGIPESSSIMASAGFAMIYTLFGGKIFIILIGSHSTHMNICPISILLFSTRIKP